MNKDPKVYIGILIIPLISLLLNLSCTNSNYKRSECIYSEDEISKLAKENRESKIIHIEKEGFYYKVYFETSPNEIAILGIRYCEISCITGKIYHPIRD